MTIFMYRKFMIQLLAPNFPLMLQMLSTRYCFPFIDLNVLDALFKNDDKCLKLLPASLYITSTLPALYSTFKIPLRSVLRK